MRLRVRIACATAAAVVLAPTATEAGLDGDDKVGTFQVRAAVKGELADGFVDSNPCEQTPPYTEFSYEPTGNALSGDVVYTYDATSGQTPDAGSTQWFVSGTGFADFYGVIDVATFEAVTVTHRQYLVGCAQPGTGDLDPATDSIVWVPVVTATTLVPDVMAELIALLPAPDVFFPVADPDQGWLIVNTPMEVRVSNAAPVSASVTAANAISSATATATATPTDVLFEPGEPGAAAVLCSTADVEAAWDRTDPDGSGCLVTYRNSSAITPSDRFQARTRVRWHVTGSGGLDMVVETVAFDTVAVAEIQAVVIAP